MFLGNRESHILRVTAVSALFVLVTTMLSFAADSSTLTWTKLKPAKGLPPRAAFASAYDPVSKKIVVFGGNNNQTDLNDTYTFDGKTWTKITTSVAPPARATAMMAYDRKIRKLVLFGGVSGFALLSDTGCGTGRRLPGPRLTRKRFLPERGRQSYSLIRPMDTWTCSGAIGANSTRATPFSGPERIGSC